MTVILCLLNGTIIFLLCYHKRIKKADLTIFFEVALNQSKITCKKLKYMRELIFYYFIYSKYIASLPVIIYLPLNIFSR